MLEIVLGAVMAGSVASLLVAIRGGDGTLEILSKGLASASFVTIGLMRWQAGDTTGSLLAIGLVACAVGDMLLLGKRSFDAGLASFLLGHIAYIVAFCTTRAPSSWPLSILLPLAVAALLIARWLWPRLGARRPAVLAYIVAITVMVWGAVATAGELGRQVAVGALLFYLSDLAVARQRFVHPSFINRGIGLPLYYAGQLLIALTV